VQEDKPSLSQLAETLLLDAALENIPYGFCVWSPQFRLVMWNRHYRDIYGFSETALRKGMTLEQVVALSAQLGNHPDQSSQEFYEAYTADLLANRSGARHKNRERVHGGRVIETAHVYSPGLGWVVTHEDVTDEIAREETVLQRKRELERQNIRLDAAVNNISQGLCMFDAQGRLVICNEPYARIYELPEALSKPGVHIEEILSHLFDKGMSGGAGAREDYLAWRRDVIARREYSKTIHELDGRMIMMQHHPMKDGGWVSTHEDITEQRQQEERIRYLARHDAMTDLPNRAQFLEEMAAMEAALSRGEKAAVLYIDLDHFKAVNDTLGHTIGDALIKQAGVRLWGTTRESDVLARLGGDEFALILRPLHADADAARAAARIIKAISNPFRIGEHRIDIGVSVGIAMAPADGDKAETLIKKADMALYKAKADGRSTYHFFEPGLDADLQRRRAIEAGLRAALDKGELRLAFQPIMGLKDNAVSCVEALLRWDHDGRTIPPAEFIPVAEETGLIVPIGEWVLREACRTATAWPESVRVAVNLSAVQFRSRELGDMVRGVLAETGLAPARLELEITESVLLAESEQVLSILHQLRALGVRISMDDFGTGYSSLSYLRSFPFDKIKVDRSFMSDLTGSSDGLAIVRAIVGLGQSLGMTTTAEGVETEEQLGLMRALGCDEIQGFLFSPPLPAAQLGHLIHSQAARRQAGKLAS
jgi:diguanylate cyclase (GGDEF)-like protein